MRTIIVMAAILALACTLVAACTTEGIEEAEMRKYDAKAREAAAPYAGEVAVITAKKDATLQELSQLSLLSKEERLFDAQLARNEFTTIVLEFRALELSIQEETEAARLVTAELEKAAEQAGPIGHNAAAAARNAWYTNWLLGIFGVVLFGFGAIVVVFAARFERRLAELGRR